MVNLPQPAQSLGLQFLKSIIDSGATQALFDVNEAFFIADDTPASEIAVYTHCKNFVQTYGQLPTQQALVQAGFNLPLRSGDNIQYYIDQLRTRAQYNRVAATHTEFFEALKSRKMADVRNLAGRMMMDIDSMESVSNFSTMAQQVGDVWSEYLQHRWSDDVLRGITTGWATPDSLTMGAQPGDLIVIVGRPGMGKSWLLMESAFQANLSGRSAMIMSMEMTVKQLALRWLARRSQINPLSIRRGFVSMWGEERILQAIHDIQNNCAQVYLEAGDMDKSIDAVEEMFRKHTPDILYLDSAYLFSPSGKRQGFVSRWEAITSVINDLKKLALRINRAIVITVQFNRNVKSSGFKEMDMSDIGDSDAIPRNASIIFGVRKHKPPFMDTKRVVQMMKNREGGNQDFAVNFDFDRVDFTETLLNEEDDEDGDETPRRRRGTRNELSSMR